jgi:type IV pilus assembly protein PilE
MGEETMRPEENAGLRRFCSARRGLQAGFTLVELMIVVAVIAILAGIALPSYTEYVRKARRTDARNALLDLASRQERFMSMNNAYTKVPANLGYGGTFPANVLSGNTAYYQIDVPTATGSAFSATAKPIAAQAADKCGTYSIDQLGTQSNTGNTLDSASCW